MKFKKFATSLLGSKYKEKGWIKCQDYSDTYETDSVQVIAMADGHGGSDYFRSEVGAKSAVNAAIGTTIHYWKKSEADANTCEEELKFSDSSIRNFKFDILANWKNLVKMHWESRKAECDGNYDNEIRYISVSDKYKARYTSDDAGEVEKYLYVAYGTTLIVAIAIKSQILILQVGDGTCVLLKRNGEFSVPVPIDEDNFLNKTSSLSEEDVFPKKFRHSIIDRKIGSSDEVVAVFLSSDGVDDCYPYHKNEEHLYRLYSMIIANVLEEGYEETLEEIETDLLQDMSDRVSQDDISLAFFISGDAEVLREAYDGVEKGYKETQDGRVDALANVPDII